MLLVALIATDVKHIKKASNKNFDLHLIPTNFRAILREKQTRQQQKSSTPDPIHGHRIYLLLSYWILNRWVSFSCCKPNFSVVKSN